MAISGVIKAAMTIRDAMTIRAMEALIDNTITCSCIRTCTCTYTRIHTRTNTHAHTHIHTHKHTHAHTHTHPRSHAHTAHAHSSPGSHSANADRVGTDCAGCLPLLLSSLHVAASIPWLFRAVGLPASPPPPLPSPHKIHPILIITLELLIQKSVLPSQPALLSGDNVNDQQI